MKNNWKKTAAFIMSMMIAAGTAAVSTGAVVSTAPLTVYAEETVSFEPADWQELCDAFKNAGDGTVIKLAADITADRSSFSVPRDKTITFDLCGHTLDMKYNSASVYGVLNIEDSSEEKTGTMKAQGTTIVNASGGTLNINGGNYIGSTTDAAVFGFSGSVSCINFNDGIINTSGSNAFSLRNNTGDLNLNGGVINCTVNDSDPYTSSCVLTGRSYKGKITLNGTEMNTTYGCGIYNQGSNDVTIELIKGSITDRKSVV